MRMFALALCCSLLVQESLCLNLRHEPDERVLISERVLDSSSSTSLYTVDTSSWNYVAKELVEGAVKVLPGGSIISSLVEVLWPSSSTDVWTMLQEKFEALVDAEILKAELDERSDDLVVLKTYMENFAAATTNTDKKSWLQQSIAKAIDLNTHLLASSNAIHLLPLAATASTLHLSLLGEQLRYGIDLQTYTSDEERAATEKAYSDALAQAILQYQTHFAIMYPAWKEGRCARVKTSTTCHDRYHEVWGDYHGEKKYKVVDELSGETHSQSLNENCDGSSDESVLSSAADGTKTRMCNDLYATMIQVLVPTLYFWNFMPGFEDNLPSPYHPDFVAFEMGPYQWTTVDNDLDTVEIITTFETGEVTAFIQTATPNLDGVGVVLEIDDNVQNSLFSINGIRYPIEEGEHSVGMNLYFQEDALTMQPVVTDGDSTKHVYAVSPSSDDVLVSATVVSSQFELVGLQSTNPISYKAVKLQYKLHGDKTSAVTLSLNLGDLGDDYNVDGDIVQLAKEVIFASFMDPPASYSDYVVSWQSELSS